jgi:hypothetical protein
MWYNSYTAKSPLIVSSGENKENLKNRKCNPEINLTLSERRSCIEEL